MLRLFLPVLAALLLTGESAAAGPWTREKGEIFTSQSFRYFSTETTTSSDVEYARLAVKVYAEYGLFEGITIGAEADQGVRMDELGRGAQDGRAGGFLRFRLGSFDGWDAAAVEIGGTASLSGLATPPAPGGDDSTEFRVMALYGRGFETPLGAAWADGAVGFSKFFGARADEYRFDLTLGLRPLGKWIAMAQIFGEKSRKNHSFGGTDFDLVKTHVSIGREFMEGKSLLLGAGRDLMTRNTSPGYEVSLSIWSVF